MRSAELKKRAAQVVLAIAKWIFPPRSAARLTAPPFLCSRGGALMVWLGLIGGPVHSNAGCVHVDQAAQKASSAGLARMLAGLDAVPDAAVMKRFLLCNEKGGSAIFSRQCGPRHSLCCGIHIIAECTSRPNTGITRHGGCQPPGSRVVG